MTLVITRSRKAPKACSRRPVSYSASVHATLALRANTEKWFIQNHVICSRSCDGERTARSRWRLAVSSTASLASRLRALRACCWAAASDIAFSCWRSWRAARTRSTAGCCNPGRAASAAVNSGASATGAFSCSSRKRSRPTCWYLDATSALTPKVTRDSQRRSVRVSPVAADGEPPGARSATATTAAPARITRIVRDARIASSTIDKTGAAPERSHRLPHGNAARPGGTRPSDPAAPLPTNEAASRRVEAYLLPARRFSR